MNIEALNELIAHLEKQPEERFNMAYSRFHDHPCGTAACLTGHCVHYFNKTLGRFIGMHDDYDKLIMPDDYINDRFGNSRYPLSRAIATLKRLRDHYLATGEVVVDWGPEPGEEPKKLWAAPVVAGGLPLSLTDALKGVDLSLAVEAEGV